MSYHPKIISISSLNALKVKSKEANLLLFVCDLTNKKDLAAETEVTETWAESMKLKVNKEGGRQTQAFF